MDGLIQVLDGLDPVSFKIVLGGFQMMLCRSHRFQRFVNVWMRLGRQWSSNRNCRYSGYGRGWRFRPGGGCRKCDCEQESCGREQTNDRDLFHSSS